MSIYLSGKKMAYGNTSCCFRVDAGSGLAVAFIRQSLWSESLWSELLWSELLWSELLWSELLLLSIVWLRIVFVVRRFECSSQT
jgi:hypothetical protein